MLWRPGWSRLFNPVGTVEHAKRRGGERRAVHRLLPHQARRAHRRQARPARRRERRPCVRRDQPGEIDVDTAHRAARPNTLLVSAIRAFGLTTFRTGFPARRGGCSASVMPFGEQQAPCQTAPRTTSLSMPSVLLEAGRVSRRVRCEEQCSDRRCRSRCSRPGSFRRDDLLQGWIGLAVLRGEVEQLAERGRLAGTSSTFSALETELHLPALGSLSDAFARRRPLSPTSRCRWIDLHLAQARVLAPETLRSPGRPRLLIVS